MIRWKGAFVASLALLAGLLLATAASAQDTESRLLKASEGLQKLFHRRYDDLAVYRCETGTAEVPIYFVGVNENGLSGLLTVNIQT